MTLPYLWLFVEQNLCEPNSITNQLNQPPLVFLGIELRLLVSGLQQRAAAGVDDDRADARRSARGYGTTLRVDLDDAARAGSVGRHLDAVWHFNVPAQGGGRMGHDGPLYEIAQWYPRLAVYDDVKGWNHEPYIGAGEFYLEYGDFDVTLTVPNEDIVAATGELQNAEQVLTPAQRQRLALARHSDTTIAIIARDEAGESAKTRPAGAWRRAAGDAHVALHRAQRARLRVRRRSRLALGRERLQRNSDRGSLSPQSRQVAGGESHGPRGDQVLQRAVVSVSVLARDDGRRADRGHGVPDAHVHAEQSRRAKTSNG